MPLESHAKWQANANRLEAGSSRPGKHEILHPRQGLQKWLKQLGEIKRGGSSWRSPILKITYLYCMEGSMMQREEDLAVRYSVAAWSKSRCLGDSELWCPHVQSGMLKSGQDQSDAGAGWSSTRPLLGNMPKQPWPHANPMKSSLGSKFCIQIIFD